ncbi:YaaL family protein [Alicyclobacillus tolerans]|uniref:DUF2508 family protein n=1 Tax=Alicyclobacillus tolerans TaxID=90970 RepID=UPI001F26BCDE|nr:DUF2508 family protein [Alicyclobacillus tolerans]MCF8566272.1 YaaL family protein [Alicyclobacillus tolerans]
MSQQNPLQQRNHSNALGVYSAVTVSFTDTSEVDVEIFLEELRQSKREVEIARKQFDLVSDPLLIDHAIFRLGAAEKQLGYLYQMARKMNIVIDDNDYEYDRERT